MFKKTGFRVFRDVTMTILIIKVSTIITHYKRSLALSAPRNFVTGMVKYIFVPGIVTFMLERNRYHNMMSDVEDLKDSEI